MSDNLHQQRLTILYLRCGRLSSFTAYFLSLMADVISLVITTPSGRRTEVWLAAWDLSVRTCICVCVCVWHIWLCLCLCAITAPSGGIKVYHHEKMPRLRCFCSYNKCCEDPGVDRLLPHRQVPSIHWQAEQMLSWALPLWSEQMEQSILHGHGRCDCDEVVSVCSGSSRFKCLFRQEANAEGIKNSIDVNGCSYSNVSELQTQQILSFSSPLIIHIGCIYIKKTGWTFCPNSLYLMLSNLCLSAQSPSEVTQWDD